MKDCHDEKRIDTTLGELIAAVSEVAFEYCEDTKEAYALAHLVLVEILKNGCYPGGQGSGILGPGSPRKNYLH